VFRTHLITQTAFVKATTWIKSMFICSKLFKYWHQSGFHIRTIDLRNIFNFLRSQYKMLYFEVLSERNYKDAKMRWRLQTFCLRWASIFTL
jgi:hypothetical protein